MTDLIQKTPYSPPKTAFEQKNCTTCNARIHRQVEICPHCGVRQLASPPDRDESRDESQVSPYPSATVSPTNDADRDTTEIELADRGTRLLAVIVDVFVMIAPFIFVLFFDNPHLDPKSLFVPSATMIGVSVIGIANWVLLLGTIMANWVLLYRYGQTIGKRLLSIKILDADGSRAGLLRILLVRGCGIPLLSTIITKGLGIPIIGALIPLLNLLLIFQNSRRCLHDMIAKTIVVKVSPGKNDTAYGSLTGAIAAITLMVVVPGILAAVMIPAAADHLKRSKVAEAIFLLGVLKTPAEQYMAAKGQFPMIEEVTTGRTSGKYVAGLVSNPNEFYFEAFMRMEDTFLGGKSVRLIYHPDTKTWSCSGAYPNGIPPKYLPSTCQE